LAGVSGTVYGGPSGGGGTIDSGAVPEAGKSETGQSLDSMSSEAGVAPPSDAKATSPREAGILDE
jgi:hypothetical protein